MSYNGVPRFVDETTDTVISMFDGLIHLNTIFAELLFVGSVKTADQTLEEELAKLKKESAEAC